MKETWVLVADEAIARVLRRPASGGTLEPVHALTDPAAHRREPQHHRDALGRRAAGVGRGGTGDHGGGFARPSSATASAADSGEHQEAERFAREVAEWLHAALLKRRFEELHIAAAPRFLGVLRKVLTPQVAERVVQQIDKDWVQTDDARLTQRLFPERPR